MSLSVWRDLEQKLSPYLIHVQPYTAQATQWTNKQLAGLQPWQIALLSICSAWLALTLARWLSDVVADVRETGKTCLIKTAQSCMESPDLIENEHSRAHASEHEPGHL